MGHGAREDESSKMKMRIDNLRYKLEVLPLFPKFAPNETCLAVHYHFNANQG